MGSSGSSNQSVLSLYEVSDISGALATHNSCPGNQQGESLSLSIPIPTKDKNISQKLPEWKQPPESYIEKLIYFLEEKDYKPSHTPQSKASLLDGLMLQTTPLCVADELLKIVNDTEDGLSFLLSISQDKDSSIELHEKKSISNVDCSNEGFIKFIRSCNIIKLTLSENYTIELRTMVLSEAENFRCTLIKTISDAENNNLISGTKQCLLSHAVENKSIDIFRKNISTTSLKFLSSITSKLDFTGLSEYELKILEFEQAKILIFMLMCYAKIAEKIISEEKINPLKRFFVKFGHVHINKMMSDKLQSIIEELPQIVSAVLIRKHSLIKKELEKKGLLSNSFIRNVIVTCTGSEEVKDLERRAKEEISKPYLKIVINGDQLVAQNSEASNYVTSVFIYNLAKSLENCIRNSISILPFEVSLQIPMEESYSSSCINSSSVSSPLNRKRLCTSPSHDYHENSKKNRRELFSNSVEEYVNVEK
ncbi:hypothetical protein (partial), partial [Candidatus Ichthyocystis hellenicum]